jgi:hypothetical protein
MMATLLSELVRVLSATAADAMRARADGPPLTRAEMLAIATVADLAAHYTGAALPVQAEAQGAPDWRALKQSAAFDLDRVEASAARRKK